MLKEEYDASRDSKCEFFTCAGPMSEEIEVGCRLIRIIARRTMTSPSKTGRQPGFALLTQVFRSTWWTPKANLFRVTLNSGPSGTLIKSDRLRSFRFQVSSFKFQECSLTCNLKP